MSTVTFTIERRIHGQYNPATVTFEIASGIVDDVWQTHDGAAIMRTGERYLVLLHARNGQPMIVLGDGRGAVRLDPTIQLPSVQQLQNTYEISCDA